MADGNMNDLIGKKIFFVNPLSSMRNYVVPALRDEELEVYIIDRYALLKSILIKNPGSVCFIHVDSGLSLNGWLLFIQDITNDPDFGELTVGVISDKITEKEKIWLTKNAKIGGGFHRASCSPTKLTDNLLEIAINNNARGRRQFVRANCYEEPGNVLVWNQDNKLMQLRLVDISTCSVAVQVPEKFGEFVKQDQQVKGATIKLGQKQYIVDFVIYGIHQRGPKILMIAIFKKETIRVLRTDLQDFIYMILHKQLLQSIELLSSDEKEYSKLGKAIKFSDIPETEGKKKKAES